MIDVFTQVPLFQDIPFEGLAELVQQGHIRVYAVGLPLMAQGEVSDSMHVILKGRVRVERTHPQLSGPLTVAELGYGETVGEMGLLDNEPRSATVTAIENTITVEIDAVTVATVLEHYPAIANALLKTLSRRLRSTDDLAAEMLQREAADASVPKENGR